MNKRQRNASQGMFALRCVECDRLLVETPSGFLSCPMGHGRLVVADGSDCSNVPNVGNGPGMFDAIDGA